MQYESSGDPENLSFPGGYIGISYEFDLKTKQKGFQISFGVAVPGIGASGNGPYIFPGIAFGNRQSQNNDSFNYIDLQLVTMFGGWAGGGYGFAFKDGKKYIRKKYFVGFLLAGYVNESNQLSSSEWQSAFKGYHLGFGLPIIGNHFYP